ncbi:DUF1800 domain-containing protein [SAR202 cluster bacterium AD-804-J14_MRT_500m]|nr:DUF1800 domain-containing protein [SAR202 cluster bacterium AD-804-J14_MRT_500m]
MITVEISQIAHLLRRAGFGATSDELERYSAQGYESTVEELLNPQNSPSGIQDEDLFRRYHPDSNNLMLLESCQSYWLYRMINSRRPLEDKLSLFWHGLFATGYTKLNQPKAILNQIAMFRRLGLGSFKTLLTELAKDPAMIFWLDNKDSHKDAVNENFGRELLELFSMGVGNYTEDDVKQTSHAFTGWTMRNEALHTTRAARDSIWPYGRLDWQFEYKVNDHDDNEKTLLGQTGRFSGQEAIDIICKHPATARFISRHLYNFFVADEPQVPAWETIPPQDPDAIETLATEFITSDHNIRSTLRVLFNSEFFKASTFARVKSPAEFVVGAAKLAGGHDFPKVEDIKLALAAVEMGQSLLDPPSVEGWHTGPEWISTGSLVSRVNFAAAEFSDINRPGVRQIIQRVRGSGDPTTPNVLVETALNSLGPVETSEETRHELLEHAKSNGELLWTSQSDVDISQRKIVEMLQLIVATQEYQMA